MAGKIQQQTPGVLALTKLFGKGLEVASAAEESVQKDNGVVWFQGDAVVIVIGCSSSSSSSGPDPFVVQELF